MCVCVRVLSACVHTYAHTYICMYVYVWAVGRVCADGHCTIGINDMCVLCMCACVHMNVCKDLPSYVFTQVVGRQAIHVIPLYVCIVCVFLCMYV